MSLLNTIFYVSYWKIGVKGDYAGFHCSWCSTAEGISIKLRSAIQADLPRWGDNPENLKLDHINKLIETGLFSGFSTLDCLVF